MVEDPLLRVHGGPAACTFGWRPWLLVEGGACRRRFQIVGAVATSVTLHS